MRKRYAGHTRTRNTRLIRSGYCTERDGWPGRNRFCRGANVTIPALFVSRETASASASQHHLAPTLGTYRSFLIPNATTSGAFLGALRFLRTTHRIAPKKTATLSILQASFTTLMSLIRAAYIGRIIIGTIASNSQASSLASSQMILYLLPISSKKGFLYSTTSPTFSMIESPDSASDNSKTMTKVYTQKNVLSNVATRRCFA